MWEKARSHLGGRERAREVKKAWAWDLRPDPRSLGRASSDDTDTSVIPVVRQLSDRRYWTTAGDALTPGDTSDGQRFAPAGGGPGREPPGWISTLVASLGSSVCAPWVFCEAGRTRRVWEQHKLERQQSGGKSEVGGQDSSISSAGSRNRAKQKQETRLSTLVSGRRRTAQIGSPWSTTHSEASKASRF
jgi:hypothetical protein